jgi:hypothetical protein
MPLSFRASINNLSSLDDCNSRNEMTQQNFLGCIIQRHGGICVNLYTKNVVVALSLYHCWCCMMIKNESILNDGISSCRCYFNHCCFDGIPKIFCFQICNVQLQRCSLLLAEGFLLLVTFDALYTCY